MRDLARKIEQMLQILQPAQKGISYLNKIQSQINHHKEMKEIQPKKHCQKMQISLMRTLFLKKILLIK